MIIKAKRIYKVNPDCDLERLNEIARANNSRIAAGEETTVTLGHTSESDPELITIPVGHAENFWVEDEDLFVDLVIDDEWVSQIKKYNKVSVELWEDQIITPIALLAKNRPALEVGLIKYDMPNRGEISHDTYITNEEDIEVENMSPQEIEQLFIETMNHSEFYSKFCDLLENVIPKIQESVKHMEDTLAPLLVEEAAEPEHEDIAPELDAEAKEIEGEEAIPEGETEEKVAEEVPAVAEEAKEKVDEVEDKPEEKKEEVEKNDMASTSANNGYIADLDNEKKKKYQANEDLVKFYQEKLLATEKEKADLLAKNDLEKKELISKYQFESRKNELNELSKKFYFEPNDEIEIVGKMDEVQWEMHKQIIATKYQKNPIGRTVSVAPMEDRDVSKPDQVQRAIKYATENGVDFKTALAACK